ncbi:TlpA disulfide reductase family protein [uncultured Winogradskyella sp.]|uniref:TlpA disulfide reductase family protein n=1 Tax=uncultured Winogradskyella sp. TaxID=395353 RepID=UPI0026221929|nr:TlpA disulfide reductase family protein [uncultured Winogradskyella sp.]
MKKILTVLVIGLFLASCKKENKTSYVIDGNAEGVHNGIRMRLAKLDEAGKQVMVDTAIVMNGKFKLEGSVEEPGVYFLLADGSPGNTIFMLENNDITINFNKEKPTESKVVGSESNKGYEAFQKGMMDIKKEGDAITAEFRKLGANATQEKRDSITDAMTNLRARQSAYPLNFVKEYNDKYFSLNLIELESSRPNFSIVEYKKAFENFTPQLKASKKGQTVKKKLDQLYKEYERIAYLEIGNVAPDFEAPSPDGQMISLEDIKGKVTIIDFWAAWCGPCRRENPNVVRIYNEYHDKGLEIIGVSLDGQGRQQDPKKAWMDAIKKDGLTWYHVSNLKYFNDPVAKQYNIQSIPATYILDADGKIVAKNLRGKALENKIKELIEKS